MRFTNPIWILLAAFFFIGVVGLIAPELLPAPVAEFWRGILHLLGRIGAQITSLINSIL